MLPMSSVTLTYETTWNDYHRIYSLADDGCRAQQCLQMFTNDAAGYVRSENSLYTS